MELGLGRYGVRDRVKEVKGTDRLYVTLEIGLRTYKADTPRESLDKTPK